MKEADMPSWVRWASVPAVAVVVTAGIWVTGALLTDDFERAPVLTGGFLTTAGVLALAVAWRWRGLAVPVLATFTLVAGGLSGWLLVGSTRDVRVEERLVAIGSPDLSQTDQTHPDPGPDLRVYAVPGTGRSAKDATDLGKLRGNVGTQQYAVPAKLSANDIGGVVIWCRAFSVNFGYATLRAT